MHTSGVRNFLTFVLSFTLCVVCLQISTSRSLAAITTPSPDFQEPPPQDEDSGSIQDEAVRQTINITEPPPLPPRSREDQSEYFYPYRKALTMRGGVAFSTKEVDGKTVLSLIGAQYKFPSSRLKNYEAGADLLSDGSGSLHFSKRFEYSRSSTRPYLKAGGGIRVVPSEQLVSFVKLGNFQIRGAAGVEQLVWHAQSVRLEAEATASTQGMLAILTLGYVWAW